MSQQLFKKVLVALWGIFLLSAVIYYVVGGEQLRYAAVDTGEMVHATNDVGELTTGKNVVQTFTINGTEICTIRLLGSSYERDVGGVLGLTIEDSNSQLIYTENIDMARFSDSDEIRIDVNPAIPCTPNSPLALKMEVIDGSTGSVPTLYYGSSISLARGEADITLEDHDKVSVESDLLDGMLCFQVSGRRALWLGTYYWLLVLVAAGGLALFSGYTLVCVRRGKQTVFVRIIAAFCKYSFLLEQLIARDFKGKYKRSILGVLWSFLNPMLMMTVQYVVFSTIFKSDIENFAVYLLTGIVCYNFFNEATSMALTSIVGNAALITKVYIPKYIYPVSRAMSSMINFLLSLIPLLVMMLVTKTPLTAAVVLLPFAIWCLLMLSLGVGMVLASSMVFFRDTQFLWNVLSMVWMYMTPIFYPENIVSGWLSYIFKLNPLYHIIRFFRIILLSGISPEPKAYLLCFVAAALPLIIGISIFRKTEDRFVLHI